MSANNREILAELERQGWRFKRTMKGQHWRGTHPRAPGKVLIVGSSPSDWRSRANVRATARRLVS